MPTAAGFETTFGTNHLGPFLLTNLLLLAGSTPPAPPRSVIISSEGQRLFPDGVNYEQPGYVVGQPDVYDTWRAYGASKAANVLFARALRRRGWEAASVHPGVILDTELARSMTREEMIAIGASFPRARFALAFCQLTRRIPRARLQASSPRTARPTLRGSPSR